MSGSSTRTCGKTRWLWWRRNKQASAGPLCGETFVQASDVDHHAFMRARADLFSLVARADIELDSPSVYLGDLGRGGHLVADRRGREMSDVHCGADGSLARFEIVADRVQRRVFHDRYHPRRRENLWQSGILELIGEMRRRHAQRVGAFGSDRDGAHGLTWLC